jgi:hypothetical protein
MDQRVEFSERGRATTCVKRLFGSQTLQHWKAVPDLAGLRDETALAKLPEDEQRACRALWAEVEALLKKARDTKP